MSKLLLNGEKVRKGNDICPQREAPSTTTNSTTTNTPIRLKEVSRLRRLGENCVCQFCHQDNCNCLWVTMEASALQDHTHVPRWQPPPAAQTCTNADNTLLDKMQTTYRKYKKQLKKHKFNSKDSVQWIMKPNREMRASKTIILPIERSLQLQYNITVEEKYLPHFKAQTHDRDALCEQTRRAANASEIDKIWKNSLNERRRKMNKISQLRKSNQQLAQNHTDLLKCPKADQNTISSKNEWLDDCIVKTILTDRERNANNMRNIGTQIWQRESDEKRKIYIYKFVERPAVCEETQCSIELPDACCSECSECSLESAELRDLHTTYSACGLKCNRFAEYVETYKEQRHEIQTQTSSLLLCTSSKSVPENECSQKENQTLVLNKMPNSNYELVLADSNSQFRQQSGWEQTDSLLKPQESAENLNVVEQKTSQPLVGQKSALTQSSSEQPYFNCSRQTVVARRKGNTSCNLTKPSTQSDKLNDKNTLSGDRKEQSPGCKSPTTLKRAENAYNLQLQQETEVPRSRQLQTTSNKTLSRPYLEKQKSFSAQPKVEEININENICSKKDGTLLKTNSSLILEQQYDYRARENNKKKPKKHKKSFRTRRTIKRRKRTKITQQNKADEQKGQQQQQTQKDKETNLNANKNEEDEQSKLIEDKTNTHVKKFKSFIKLYRKTKVMYKSIKTKATAILKEEVEPPEKPKEEVIETIPTKTKKVHKKKSRKQVSIQQKKRKARTNCTEGQQQNKNLQNHDGKTTQSIINNMSCDSVISTLPTNGGCTISFHAPVNVNFNRKSMKSH